MSEFARSKCKFACIVVPGFIIIFRDRQRNVGLIECRVCKENFQTNINYLSEPIDVYADWVDACEAANN